MSAYLPLSVYMSVCLFVCLLDAASELLTWLYVGKRFVFQVPIDLNVDPLFQERFPCLINFLELLMRLSELFVLLTKLLQFRFKLLKAKQGRLLFRNCIRWRKFTFSFFPPTALMIGSHL